MYRVWYAVSLSCCLAAPALHSQVHGASAGVAGDEPVAAVQVVSGARMAKDDAALLARHRPEVMQAAEFYGYDVSSGLWITNQVLCPDAPRHLILHYLHLAQDGPVSLFTAVIPRDAGKVRIIPVLSHGGPAHRVFGSSPEQRELINQVIPRKGEALAAGAKLDWARLGFCYAALAGAEPAAMDGAAAEEITPELAVAPDGRVSAMSFTLRGPDRSSQDWNIRFDRQGQVSTIAFSIQPWRELQQVPEAEAWKKARPVPPPK